MSKARVATLANQTRIALKLLGDMIQAGRKVRKMSQKDLAERLNVSRYTVMSIESGSPNVAAGTVFEAAAIVGIPLLAHNKKDLNRLAVSIAGLTSVLPAKSGYKRPGVDDDF
jgi:transcriptional regulator with XRE-family HTH domain